MSSDNNSDGVDDHHFEHSGDCWICQKNFHAFRRRHRCKSCGNAVCSTCARTHRLLPRSNLVHSNEPVRVCDRCVVEQQQQYQERKKKAETERQRLLQQQQQLLRVQQQQRKAQQEAEAQEQLKKQQLMQQQQQYNQMVEFYFGDIKDRQKITRAHTFTCGLDNFHKLSHSEEQRLFMDDAKLRSAKLELGSNVVEEVAEAEECAICLESMDVGNAIFTTACGHSFHWSCLRDIQSSDSGNYDKCPACRCVMTELQVKNKCDHPRVRQNHKYCRDCGSQVSDSDVKLRPEERAAERRSIVSNTPPSSNVPPPNNRTNSSNRNASSNSSYQSNGTQGAVVRCPQCHIQMRVLPHMFNMRVACPAGHQFQVAVSGGRNTNSNTRIGSQGYPGTSYRQAL